MLREYLLYGPNEKWIIATGVCLCIYLFRVCVCEIQIEREQNKTRESKEG